MMRATLTPPSPSPTRAQGFCFDCFDCLTFVSVLPVAQILHWIDLVENAHDDEQQQYYLKYITGCTVSVMIKSALDGVRHAFDSFKLGKAKMCENTYVEAETQTQTQ